MEKTFAIKPVPGTLRAAAAVAAFAASLMLAQAMTGLANHYAQQTNLQNRMPLDTRIAAARANSAQCEPGD